MSQKIVRTSGIEVFVNGAILVLIAVFGAVLSDSYLTKLIGETVTHVLGVAVVGLATIKGFTSDAFSNLKNQRAQDAPDAPPSGTPDDPVSVTETPAPT